MRKLLTFFDGTEGKFSMMRLISLITALGGLWLIERHPEQAMYIAPIVVGSQVFKWAQSKCGE